VEDNLGQGILLEDKHPLDNLEEEEHQLEPVAGCSNSSFFRTIALLLNKIFENERRYYTNEGKCKVSGGSYRSER
jgi:hypothetical protein